MPEPTPDLEAIVERINNAHRASEGIYTATAYDEFHRLIFADWPTIRAALERADEVADQGCEECDSMVTDYGPEGEPHGHWWLCGECANKRAVQTSTIIQDLKQRTAELERALGESVKLQSHYAELLNMYDGGQRMQFPTMESWLERLALLARSAAAKEGK